MFGAKPSKKTQAVDPVIAEVVKEESIRDLAHLVEDMLRDPMCVMTLGVLLASIKRADVTIKLETETEDDPRALAIQEDIQRLWLETLEKLVDPRNGVLTWGGLPFEIMTENAEDDEIAMTRIATLKQLPKHINGSRATEQVLDAEGKFGGIRVTINGSDFVIPAEQSCWIAIGATPLEPHGRSVFVGAPAEVRKRRKKTDELFDAFISRWAISGPTVHAPALAYDQFNNPINNHELIAKQFATNHKNGAVTIFPNTPAGPGMDGKYEIDITHETRALDSAPLETIDNLIDAKMSRAFGVHESVTMDTETGSYASQTVRMFVVLSQCDSYVSQIVAGFRGVVERVYLRANYAAGAGAVSLQIMPVSLVTDGFLIETVKSILAMPQWGPLLESGAVDVATILTNAGIPLASDYRERIDEAFEAVKAAKEQAAEQFNQQRGGAGAKEDSLAVKKKSAMDSVSQLMQ